MGCGDLGADVMKRILEVVPRGRPEGEIEGKLSGFYVMLVLKKIACSAIMEFVNMNKL